MCGRIKIKKEFVKVGYELGTGTEVKIPMSHTIVTGVSQHSGKTTAIEGIVNRLPEQYKVVVFNTKPDEQCFKGNNIPLFFKYSRNWQFIEGLLSLSLGKKLNDKYVSLIISYSENTKSMEGFYLNICEGLHKTKIIGDRDVLTVMKAQLEIIMPKLEQIKYSTKLELPYKINVIDLTEQDLTIQSIVMNSVLEEVLTTQKYTVIVLPELWKFAPQIQNMPTKIAIETFIRQGASNKNFIIADSQDLANVSKAIIKQCTTYILGYQSEFNEIRHTILQIFDKFGHNITPDTIMSLKIGQFYVVNKDTVKKVYAQPVFLDDFHSETLAKGKEAVEELLFAIETFKKAKTLS